MVSVMAPLLEGFFSKSHAPIPSALVLLQTVPDLVHAQSPTIARVHPDGRIRKLSWRRQVVLDQGVANSDPRRSQLPLVVRARVELGELLLHQGGDLVQGLLDRPARHLSTMAGGLRAGGTTMASNGNFTVHLLVSNMRTIVK